MNWQSCFMVYIEYRLHSRLNSKAGVRALQRCSDPADVLDGPVCHLSHILPQHHSSVADKQVGCPNGAGFGISCTIAHHDHPLQAVPLQAEIVIRTKKSSCSVCVLALSMQSVTCLTYTTASLLPPLCDVNSCASKPA